MTPTTITVGRRLIPLEQIALVMPFNKADHPDIQTEKDFKARLVLVDGESVLVEQEPRRFSEPYGFRLLPDDSVWVNADAVKFSAEVFEPSDDFKPTKPYRTRILWRSPFDGERHSKLLLTPPEVIIAVAVRGESPESAPSAAPKASRAGKRRRSPGSAEAPEPA